MPFPDFTPARSLRLLTLVCMLGCAPLAHADDYAEVGRLLRTGQAEQALAKADQYLAGKPRDPQMRFLQASSLAQLGRREAALAAFIGLTQDYPELPEPYNNLAVLYAGQGEFDKSRAALESALRANPGYANAHENLGDVQARLALQSYARALQLDPANATAKAKLAALRELLNTPQTAARQPPIAAPAPTSR